MIQGVARYTQRGFTIVELLVVIVVIAILAAISIAAYSGIQQRAKSTALLSAVDQWTKTVALEGVDNKTLVAHSCLGRPGDFPAADGFAESVCVVQDGTSVLTYSESAFADWSTQQRPSGMLPVTELRHEGIVLRARGVWIHSILSDQRKVGIAWVPQLSGECGRGDVVIGNPNPLAGGFCIVYAQY